MKYALVITGLLAGIAIAAPDLVLLGYVLLIVPGIILTIAPTVFVYLHSRRSFGDCCPSPLR
jgi:hypothetical protein